MAAPLLFTPMTIRGVTLKNRAVVAPMHQYAALRGFATDWHLMNAGRYAAGGAGLVIMESTKVERRGAGTMGDLGLWDDAHIPGLARCVAFIKTHGSVAGIQLGHSGRKARRFRPWEGGRPLVRTAAVEAEAGPWEEWELVAPSAVNSPDSDPVPRGLTRAEVQTLVGTWAAAAARADRAGFEVLEIHGAHGYLIHQFLSPFSNLRNDDYGGSELNRMRFCLEIVEAVRAVWPAHKPLFLRLSVDDDAGWDPDASSRLAALVKPKGVDVIDCSSGGMRGAPVVSAGPITYGYQVPYATKIRREADILTMAVGLIVHADQAEGILQRGEADLIALARELLYNPNWPMDAAQKLGVDPEFALVPPPQAYWLEKRARQVKDMVPSTYRETLGA
ncbi:MAG: NADH:flavin oxidoreductase/NADH oxidase [Belnapia sp.]|nr:NADH:flavin oxidoreductase/NADH oxidase [Belnapia sp.]